MSTTRRLNVGIVLDHDDALLSVRCSGAFGFDDFGAFGFEDIVALDKGRGLSWRVA